MSATMEVRSDGVAVITMSNPPVNALAPLIIKEVKDKYAEAMNRDDVRAIVLTGGGGRFSAGLDINVFQSVHKSGDLSLLPDESVELVANTIEDGKKPSVAAVEVLALGGGLELAMGCHARISAPGAQLGLPELVLGVIPGFGGTQRLPRLVGLPNAINMLLTSKPILSEEGKNLGLIDAIVSSEELLTVACRWALEIVDGRKPWIRSLERTDKLGSLSEVREILKLARQQARRMAPHMHQHQSCLDVIEEGIVFGGYSGVLKETKTFKELILSSTCKSLVHLFFAQRSTSKIAELTRRWDDHFHISSAVAAGSCSFPSPNRYGSGRLRDDANATSAGSSQRDQSHDLGFSPVGLSQDRSPVDPNEEYHHGPPVDKITEDRASGHGPSEVGNSIGLDSDIRSTSTSGLVFGPPSDLGDDAFLQNPVCSMGAVSVLSASGNLNHTHVEGVTDPCQTMEITRPIFNRLVTAENPPKTKAIPKRPSYVAIWRRSFMRLKKQREEASYAEWTTLRKGLAQRGKVKAANMQLKVTTGDGGAGHAVSGEVMAGNRGELVCNIVTHEPADDISPLEIWPQRVFAEVVNVNNRTGNGDSDIVENEEEESLPLAHIDVEALLEDREKICSVEAGIAAGFPSYLCRLETGCLKLEDWLHHVQAGMLRGDLSNSVTFGKDLLFSGEVIKGFTLWRILKLHASSQESVKVKKLWDKLIGSPIVDSLVVNGISANASWLINGPPTLPAFGSMCSDGL